MLSQLTIPKRTPITTVDDAGTPLDYERLFVVGLQHIERLASRLWTDYNVHDPGITTLELLCYAITDLSYRASFPIKDLLASETDNELEMAGQFFSARKILPNRALTLADYRKLLIDVEGVQNAWILPVTETYYADTEAGQLYGTPPVGQTGIVAVSLSGLYEVRVEFTDDIATSVDPDAEGKVLQAAMEVLQANRNVCEDFVSISGIDNQEFVLCAELELAPEADITEVHAQILFQVDEYLSPPVNQYTLSEMLEKTTADGTPYTAERIFDGPVLEHGFITDEELEISELRTEIRLSDIINIIMDIEGVRAIRDIIVSPDGTVGGVKNKWVLPIDAGKQALLSRDKWRLVSYKGAMPFTPDEATVTARWLELSGTDAKPLNDDDFPIPLGRYRDSGEYYSFQNHFPEVYGIGPAGVGDVSDDERVALARQLKGYLLFFDQAMANYFSQLSHVRDLFSMDENMERTYFYQVVDSFVDYDLIYNMAPEDVVPSIEAAIEDPDVLVERRNRFLDHMIARFAERFHDFVHTMYDEFGATSVEMIPYKCAFLQRYPAISSERSLAYDFTLTGTADLWDSENTSGLERRLAALLGIEDATRRDLGDDPEAEGMYLVENILLRPELTGDPFLPICPDPNCKECSDEDPYSYRIHIVLPAYGPRFGDIDFRRWAEGVIRSEVPAHIQPKICWIKQTDMGTLQTLYKDWITLRAGMRADAIRTSVPPPPPATPPASRAARLTAFINELYTVRNIYPQESLNDCDSPESEPKFILGRSALGTM